MECKHVSVVYKENVELNSTMYCLWFVPSSILPYIPFSRFLYYSFVNAGSISFCSSEPVQPAISASQDTLPTATSEPSQSLGDTSNGSTSLETSDSNPSPLPLRLTNVYLIVNRCSTAKRASRPHSDVSTLACPLCGRVFKKKKFFDDHCTLCQQVSSAIFPSIPHFS